MKLLLAYVFFLLSCNQVNGLLEEKDFIKGKVVKIIDGDTFDVLTESKITIRIRLLGIDAPERKQDYYQVSKDGLANYIYLKNVTIETAGTDQYKRTLGVVYHDKKNINLEMVRNGYAWHYKRYSKDKKLEAAEKNARNLQLGLWHINDPIAPWDYRGSAKKKS